MRELEMIPVDPVVYDKTIRRDRKRVVTSAKAGKIVPLAYVPLLREDRLSRGTFSVDLSMMETADILLNAIHVNVMAHFVPFLAFDRFKGMDDFNRSYQGVPEAHNGIAIPFFETMTFDRNTNDIWRTMGMHAKQGGTINTMVIEAYNEVVNFRRKARSDKLPLRTKNEVTLATGFWPQTSMAHIVPDFDQAMMDGEVTLNIVSQNLPVKGIGINSNGTATTLARKETGGTNTTELGWLVNGASTSSPGLAQLAIKQGVAGFPDVFAQLGAQGVKLSLSNIELAKKTAAFAELRSKFSGLDDDHIIDLLMQGVRVPDEALKQPILLDQKKTLVGYNRRFATDAANLDESVTDGATGVVLTMRLPPMNTGGVIIITAEVCPEQIFERRKDFFNHMTNINQFPEKFRDFADPEKVSIVTNDYVDIDHATPNATFGYAPLNHEWQRDLVNVGGKFFRPASDSTFVEDRQQIWTVEQPNPTFNADFVLASTLHQKVFADTLSDAFEFHCRGDFDIVGLTEFGKGLQERTNDFAALDAQVDKTRIVQP